MKQYPQWLIGFLMLTGVLACNLGDPIEEYDINAPFLALGNEYIKCNYAGLSLNFNVVKQADYLASYSMRRFNTADISAPKSYLEFNFSGVNFDTLTLPYELKATGSNITANLTIALDTVAANNIILYSSPRGFNGTGAARDSINVKLTQKTADGRIVGTFSGKRLNGRDVTNGDFILRYRKI